MSVSVQARDFDLGEEVRALRGHDRRVGAVASFVGTVRDLATSPELVSMTLEHYPGMTEAALEAIVAEARQRFDLLGVRVIHRIGELRPLDQIVMVAVASAHRGEAFAACEFLIDYLKTRAPFWKKEATVEGERWVEARTSDDAAADRWRASWSDDGSAA